MNTRPYLHSVYLRYLPRELRAAGVDATRILARHGVSDRELNDPDYRFELDAYTALLDDVLESTSIPGLGYKVGRHIDQLQQGLFGYAVACARNLQQAFEISSNYFSLQQNYISDRVVTDGDTAMYQLNTRTLGDSLKLERFEAELDFAMWIRASIQWWGKLTHWFNEVHFCGPEPDDASGFRRHFRCPVVFNRPGNQFLFDSALLTKPFKGFDQGLLSTTERQLSLLMGQRRSADVLVSRIRALLIRRGNRLPVLNEVAAMLNMSGITLHRHLRKAGTTYRQLVLDYRMELACRYLGETSLSVQEIAYLTGYSAASNFSRAFAGVYGTTPSEFRDRTVR